MIDVNKYSYSSYSIPFIIINFFRNKKEVKPTIINTTSTQPKNVSNINSDSLVDRVGQYRIFIIAAFAEEFYDCKIEVGRS